MKRQQPDGSYRDEGPSGAKGKRGKHRRLKRSRRKAARHKS